VETGGFIGHSGGIGVRVWLWSFLVFRRLFFILNVVMLMEAKAQNAVFNRVKAVPGRKK
jgi:hypothetical protein